ncbi:MAG TPA: TrbI/VirB10 family protein [Vicinamibacterales bacterium]
MFSRPLAFLLLALACITAAAGGAYVATRRSVSDAPTAAASAPAPPAAAKTAAASRSQPVTETEAAVSSAKPDAPAEPAPTVKPETAAPAPVRRADATASKKSAPVARPEQRASANAERPLPQHGGASAPQIETQPAPVQAMPAAPEPARPVEPAPEPRREPQFEDLILPTASVIGLQLDTALSSDRSRVEDRVDAHVTRDVVVQGRVAIPSGSKVIGSVIAVEQGGKIKEPARLAIRFHTLILADGSQVMLRTEAIDRRSESPANSSTKKIGGAAVAGTILGAIIGGGKGAAAGGAIGAAGGTAAVMAGDRSTVTMPAGQLLNARLSSPATITIAKQDQ